MTRCMPADSQKMRCHPERAFCAKDPCNSRQTAQVLRFAQNDKASDGKADADWINEKPVAPEAESRKPSTLPRLRSSPASPDWKIPPDLSPPNPPESFCQVRFRRPSAR